MKDEIEKMKQETHNLPVPDDAPWLNLSQEEVEELRNKKYELTEYGKQKLRELMDKEAERKVIEAVEKLYAENGEALKQLAEKLKND
jgi:DNA-binding PadR family transcriptional regulator